MFCRNCGKSMPDNQRFCTECGTDMFSTVNNTYNQRPSNHNYQPNYNYAPNFYNAPEYRATPNSYNPNYVYPHASEKGQGMAIASLIMGIVSIVFCCYGIIPSVLGIVFGCIAKSQGSKSPMATAGIVCSAVGAAIFVFTWLIYFTSYYSYYPYL